MMRKVLPLILTLSAACTGNLDGGITNPPSEDSDAGADGSGGGDGAGDGTTDDDVDAGTGTQEPGERDGGVLPEDAGTPDAGPFVTDPGTEGDGRFEIGADYQDAEDTQQRDVPHGQIFRFELSSEGSEFYDGFDPTLKDENMHPFSRRIDVYVPAQYIDGTPAPLLVVHDGPGYVGVVSTTLDNLIAAGKLPKIVTVFVNHGGGDSIGSERGLEYDTMSDKYTRFVEAEVLPAVLENGDVAAAYPNLTFISHPEGRSAMGCSSGGAAALAMGWFRPDLYRRIITFSGTFVDQQNPEAPTEAEFPLGAWEYHNGLISNSEVKPLRIFLQVGENDLGAGQPESTYHNWVMANERTAEDLLAKGYHHRFLYSRGANHCDGRVLRQVLPETLLWTWRGYPLD